jgi:hypothetical protein
MYALNGCMLPVKAGYEFTADAQQKLAVAFAKLNGLHGSPMLCRLCLCNTKGISYGKSKLWMKDCDWHGRICNGLKQQQLPATAELSA